MKNRFEKAVKSKTKLRLCLCGTSGSGKTYSSLLLAQGLGGKVAFIDTEFGSGRTYSTELSNMGFEYDILALEPPFTPASYVQAIKDAEAFGYEVLIIDSLTHAWAGEGGALDMQTDAMKGQKTVNSYTAWRDVTPEHNKMVNAILQSKCHVIATMRSKTHYDLEDAGGGKKKPVKAGLAPIQRDGMDYEFTVVLDIANPSHYASASKDRTRLFDGKNFIITEKTGKDLLNWLNDGKDEEAEKEANALERKEHFKKLIEEADSNLGLQTHFGMAWKELGDMGKLNNKHALAARDELKELYNKRKVELPEPVVEEVK